MSDAENDVVCYMCEKVEADLDRVIECMSCNRSVHFRCKKLRGNAIGRAKKKPFFCTVECYDLHERQSKSGNSNSILIQEMRALAQSVREARQESANVRITLEQTQMQIDTQMVELIRTNKHIESSQDFLAEKFESLKTTLDNFKSELMTLKSENRVLKLDLHGYREQNKALSCRVDGLEMQLDRLNRTALARNAVLLGLPMLENENTRQIVQDIAQAVGCSLSEDDVIQARRLSNNKTSSNAVPILIYFKTELAKNNLFEAKRQYGLLKASSICPLFAGSTRTVTLRDELTTYGKELLEETKKIQEEMNIKYAWPGRNGKILIKRYDGAKVEKISSKQDLATITASHYKRNLNSTANSSILMSSPKRQYTEN